MYIYIYILGQNIIYFPIDSGMVIIPFLAASLFETAKAPIVDWYEAMTDPESDKSPPRHREGDS
jgi:hypothetical protein